MEAKAELCRLLLTPATTILFKKEKLISDHEMTEDSEPDSSEDESEEELDEPTQIDIAARLGAKSLEKMQSYWLQNDMSK